MVVQPDDTTRAGGAQTRTPERYDFGRPAALSREHTRALAGAFDAFARLWAMQVTSKTRMRAHIAVERVSLETYDEYVDTIPGTTTLVLCAAEGSDDRAVVEFPLSTAMSWIVRMLGGDTASPLEGRTLTGIEQALLRAMMDETLAHLRASLGDLVPAEFAVSAVQYNPAFAQIVAARDLVVVARFSMRLADRMEAASVALPAAVLLERLSRTATTAHALTDPDVVRRHVDETPVELVLRLAPRAMSPADVLGLSVGDVIPLPHAETRPLDLTVGEHVVAAGAVGVSGARLACVVTSSDPSPTLAEEQP